MINPNLNLKTNFSFLSSTLTVKKAIFLTKKNNYEHFIICEKNSLASAVKCYNLAIENNLKIIFSIDIDFLEFSVLLMIQNLQGWKNAIFILNKNSFSQKLSFFSSEIKFDGLFIIFHQKIEDKYLEIIKNDLKDNYFFNFYHYETTFLENKLVFATDIRTDSEKNLSFLKILFQIKKEDFNFTKDNYLYYLTENKIKENQKKYLKNNFFLYQSCTFDLKELNFSNFKDSFFLNNQNFSDYVYQKFDKFIKKNPLINKEIYQKRLEKELELVEKFNFSNYFLIVQDYVNFAKKNQIAVGPGRGSGCSSLICYLLNITIIDPIKYNLLFERFLNLHRLKLPDIDVDFCDEKRHEVLLYLKKKYQNNAAIIGTFQIIGIKTAIRDIARTLNYSLAFADSLSKLVKKESISLTWYYENDGKVFSLFKNFSVEKNFCLYVDKLINFPRQFGIHAAGVIIQSENLEEKLPFFYANHELSCLQWDMNDLESFKLMKFDILGLKSLSIVANVETKIKEKFSDFDVWKIDFSDQKVFKIFTKKYTNGIFQLESQGMKSALEMIAPTSVEEIAMAISMYRPGPKKYIQELSLRKTKNKSYSIIDESLKEILQPTYGIIIYQEQVIEIFQKICNLSFDKSEELRIIISKKQVEKIEDLKKYFFETGLKNNFNKKKLQEIFDYIVLFVNYGFNKAHAIAYATLSYIMAYLKYYYPIHFYTENLNVNKGIIDDKFKTYVFELKEQNIKFLPQLFTKLKPYFYSEIDTIYYPILIIKNIGTALISKFIQKHDKFLTSKTFIETYVILRTLNLKNEKIKELIVLGFLDYLQEYNRTTKIKNLEKLKEFSEIVIHKNQEYDLSIVSFPKINKYLNDYNELKKKERSLLNFNIWYNSFFYFEQKILFIRKDIKRIYFYSYLEILSKEKKAEISRFLLIGKVINLFKTSDYLLVKVLNNSKIFEIKYFSQKKIEKNYFYLMQLKFSKYEKFYLEDLSLLKYNHNTNETSN
ncbi:DNA polymerase III subunit alpha [symbiont of Argiope bruennichi]|uniref:DNA polymerase III subunit alpha n=1 Tax=symbiont of Argiope bruennichi TaxID=2810479 RepID=UPI003DA3DAF2